MEEKEKENLRLRSLREEDAEALFSLTSDERVSRFMRFGTHTVLRQARELIQDYKRGAAFAVEREQEFVGVFALKPGETEEEYSISAFFSPRFWGRGYATEVLRRGVDFAQRTLGAKRLAAYVVEENTGSRRVLEKNGFSVKKRVLFSEGEGALLVYKRDL